MDLISGLHCTCCHQQMLELTQDLARAVRLNCNCRGTAVYDIGIVFAGPTTNVSHMTQRVGGIVATSFVDFCRFLQLSESSLVVSSSFSCDFSFALAVELPCKIAPYPIWIYPYYTELRPSCEPSSVLKLPP